MQKKTKEGSKFLASSSYRPLLDPLELRGSTPHKPGGCLTPKLPMRDGSGKIIGLIGISRDVCAPIETHDIPVEFAAALDHFENNVADSVTPSALARRARLAPPRFARLMKRFFGLTPSQFIAKTRIAAASRLLRETDPFRRRDRAGLRVLRPQRLHPHFSRNDRADADTIACRISSSDSIDPITTRIAKAL